MNKISLLILTYFLIPVGLLFAQSTPSGLWKPVDIHTQDLTADEIEIVQAIDGDYFSIDEVTMQNIISRVATDYRESVSLNLPISDKISGTVELKAYNVMHPDLAARYPHINTYRGNYDGVSIYATLSPLGIHAYILSPEGYVFIEPLSTTTTTLYQRYTSQDIKDFSSILNCGLDNEDMLLSDEVVNEDMAESRSSKATVLRYRLAMLSTEAYARHYNWNFDNTFASIVNLVNGLNLIYVNNMGIEFQMIERSDELIFTDMDEDPYGEENQNGPLLLATNTTVLYELVGGDSFDIGHVVTHRCTEGNFGGVSRGSTACNNPIKGAGVTCSSSPGGGLHTTAHEFGHHFSAGHTWSNCPPQMDQYRSDTAVEPGSGFTILSYAGACGSQNLNIPSVNWFHNKSLDQIISYSRTGIGSTCAEVIELDYNLPEVVINAESGTYIPISTAFELDGELLGYEGEETVYFNFEQLDLGPMSPVGEPEGNAPSFISQDLTTTPYRHFPRLNYAMAHAFYKMEVLPTYERDLTFRLTAREGGAGQAVWDEIKLHSTEEAGPFRVTSQDSRVEYVAGQKIVVEWDVANTDQAPVNCNRVDIYYSHNNGTTFTKVAENVKNAGIAEVFVPTRTTSLARFKVKAADNVFLDYNHTAFSIIAPEEPTFTVNYAPYFRELCTPALHEIEINTEALLDFEGEITLSFVEDLPSSIGWEFDKNPIVAGESTVLRLDLSQFRGKGDFIYDIRATSETDTLEFGFGFEATGNFFDDFALVAPFDGEDDTEQAPLFEWAADLDADSYYFELADHPFVATWPLVHQAQFTGTQFQYKSLLEKSKVYYWRVRPINKCGMGPWSQVNVFKTVQQECTLVRSGNLDLFISPIAGNVVKGPIDIDSRGAAVSLNIPKIVGEHDWIGNISGTLESPSGTQVLLWDRKCGNGANFNLGFDDASPIEINCPLNNGRVFRPEESLSAFLGEDVRGQWNLIIKTHNGGEYGVFKNWEMEVCFESQAESPNIYWQDTLRIQFDTEQPLSSAIRLSHAKYGPWDIEIHPLDLPEYGTIYQIDSNGEYVEVTTLSTFTMQDIYDDRVVVRHNGGDEVEDGFRYFVITPDGGWTGSQRMPIKYQEDVVVSVKTVTVEEAELKVWPSPATDIIYVQMDADPMQGEWQLFDMYGQLVRSVKVDNSSIKTSITVDNCTPGMYFVKWNSSGFQTSKKILIQK